MHPCQLDAAIALCSVAQSFLLQMICSLTIPHSRRLVEHSTCWLQTHRQSTPCTHSPPPAPLLEEQLTGNTFMSLLNARLLVTHQRASARSIPEYIYKSSLLPFFFFFFKPINSVSPDRQRKADRKLESTQGSLQCLHSPKPMAIPALSLHLTADPRHCCWASQAHVFHTRWALATSSGPGSVPRSSPACPRPSSQPEQPIWNHAEDCS